MTTNDTNKLIEIAKAWLETDEAKEQIREAFKQVAEMQMHLSKATKLTSEQLNTPFVPVLTAFNQATIDAVNADKQSVSAKVLLDIVYSEQFEPRDRLQRIASNLIMSKATTIDREDVIAGTGDYIKRSDAVKAFKKLYQPDCPREILEAINSIPAINAQTNNEPVYFVPVTKELYLKGDATKLDSYKVYADAPIEKYYKPNNTNSIETNSAPVEHIYQVLTADHWKDCTKERYDDHIGTKRIVYLANNANSIETNSASAEIKG